MYEICFISSDIKKVSERYPIVGDGTPFTAEVKINRKATIIGYFLYNKNGKLIAIRKINPVFVLSGDTVSFETKLEIKLESGRELEQDELIFRFRKKKKCS